MPTPAQIGAATAAVGGGALGGYLIANGLSGTKVSEKLKSTPELMSQVQSLQEYPLLGLTKESNLPHLLKPIQNKKAQEWWESIFADRYKKLSKSKDSLFEGLTSAYSETAATGSAAKQTSLNQACDAAYKKTKNEYSFETTSFLLQNISDFCTIDLNGFDISEPKSALHTAHKTADGYEYGVLGVAKNASKLVTKDSDTNNNNDLWWNWSFKKLLTDEAKKTASEHFKKATSAFNASTQTALNLVCDSAYKKPFVALNSDSKKLFNDIKKFCTPGNSSDEDLNLPTGEPETTDYLGSSNGFETTYNNSNFAKDSENKNKLIDPLKSETWWKWMYANYYPSNDTTEKNKYTDPFDKVTSAFSSESSVTTSLNNTCKTVYSKTNTDLEKQESGKIKLLDLIKKFCISEKHRSQGLKNP